MLATPCGTLLKAADSLLNASYVVLVCENVIAVAYSAIPDPLTRNRPAVADRAPACGRAKSLADERRMRLRLVACRLIRSLP
jgi:hypothetical protein